MIYLHQFRLPTLAQEEDHAGRFWQNGNPHSHEYPYGIFPYKRLQQVDFSEITIFYGGNGSGKTTILNLIAESLQLTRITPINRSIYFMEYVNRMCSTEAASVALKNTVPNGSAIFSESICGTTVCIFSMNRKTAFHRSISFSLSNFCKTAPDFITASL